MSYDFVPTSALKRLDALYSTHLLDTPAEDCFDRITRLASKLLDAPVALISLVDQDRQFFKSCVGLPPPWAATRQTPLSHSFCQHVVTSNAVLVINDARLDERVRDNLAIVDLGVIAYIGAPLTTTGGETIGALCVIDSKPRPWTDEQATTLCDMSSFVMVEIERRRAAAAEQAAKIDLKQAEMHFLADVMPQIVWTAKPDGSVKYYNQRWYEYTGLTFEQTKDWSWKPVVHPDDLENCITQLTECLAAGTAFQIELRMKRVTDGAYRWHLARSLPMRDSAGNIVQWVGTSTDIHDQKMVATDLEKARFELEARVAERTAQLQQEKQFADAILDNITDGIVACDAAGKVTIINRAAQHIHGTNDQTMPPGGWEGKFDLYLVDGTEPLSVEELPLSLALKGETVEDVELFIVPAGKSRRRLRVNGRALIDGEGRRFGAVVGIHDITERAAAEAKFRMIFESSSDAHLLVDDTGIVDCNNAAVTLLGYRNKDEILAIHPSTFSPEFQPDGQRSSEKAGEMDAIARRLGSHRFEWTHRRCNGALFSAEVTLTMVEVEGMPRILAVCHDLTEQKAAEEKLRRAYTSLTDANVLLRQSEERFQAFMDNSPAVCFIKDEDSRLVYINKYFATLFEGANASLVGKTDFDFLEPAVARQMVTNDRLVLSKNEPVEFIEVIPLADGGLQQWMSLKFPLSASDGNKMVGGICFDVTARKKAEEEMEKQKRFIEAVLENVSDGIVACDTAGQITYLNGSMRQMNGIVNMPCTPGTEWATEHLSLYHPVTEQLLEWEARPLALALQNQPVNAIEYQIRPKVGGPRHIVASSRTMADKDGHIIGAVALWHDVTDLRRSQQELLTAKNAAEAANLVKGEFLANMSHEIRTPMTAIIGYADMLAVPKRSAAERDEYVNTIRRNGEHLLCVINDILDLSKIEAGKMQVEQTAISLTRIMAEVASSMRVRATEKGIDFEVKSQGDIPDTIYSDPTRIRQILFNLVGNAIKFTRAGGVCVTVSCDVVTRTLRLAVSDSGIGLTSEQVCGLFQPFAQADSSTTRRFGGTGLGLAVSKRLVEMLGGELSVESNVGVGSTFSFTLQYHIIAGEGSEEVLSYDQCELPMDEQAVRTFHGRVLLAEDSVDNQRLVQAYLEDAGLSIEFANNGRIAVDMILASEQRGTPYDCVLMDMQMPELDGYAATRELRSRGITRLPIIAFTAHAMASESEKCSRAGCDDYATKPVEPVSLINTIVKHIVRARIASAALRPPLSKSDSQDQTPTTPFAGTSNMETIQSNIRGNNPISRILPEYVAGLPAHIGRMSEYLAAAEIEELRMLAHQLKGSGGSYGFPCITTLAKAVEETIQGGAEIERIARELNELIESVRRVEGYDRTKETSVRL